MFVALLLKLSDKFKIFQNKKLGRKKPHKVFDIQFLVPGCCLNQEAKIISLLCVRHFRLIRDKIHAPKGLIM